MSRVGKKEIFIPDKVNVSYKNRKIEVEGGKGKLGLNLNPMVDLVIEEGNIKVITINNTKKGRSLQGLTRSLIFNMIVGVSKGFERSLEINGIGYKVEQKGNKLIFNLGYSHLVNFELPESVTVMVDKNIVKLFSIDKGKLGQVASSIRQLKPPESYKGKGIKYADERIKRKTGKSGVK